MRLSVRPVMRVVTGLFGPWRTGLKVWYCRAYRCFRVRPSRLLGKAVRDEKKTARRRPFAPIKTVRTAFPSGTHPASPRKPISLVLPFIDSRGTHRRVRGGYPNGEGSDSKSDAGFAGCGFDSRALRLEFRSSNCLNTSGLRNQEPRFPRGFSRFLAVPPFRSNNDTSIRFDTFCYRQPSLSGTWYGTNLGTFRRFSAPIRAPFDAVKTGLEIMGIQAGQAGS